MRDLKRFYVFGLETEKPKPVLMEQWIPKGKLFYSGGVPITHKGFTAFKLLNLYEGGNDITPFLNQFEGSNAARTFMYTPVKDWHQSAWGWPSIQATLDFIEFMKSKGLVSKLCLITDDDENNLEPAKETVAKLKEAKVTSVLLEACNEAHLDKVDPSKLKNVLTGSGIPYTSGQYADTRLHYGTYWVDHSERSRDWFRKGGHNLFDAYSGGGPNFPQEPALKQPGVEDEPIRPDQCGYDALGLYAYAASCVLLGAGATFHCESGKLCNLLSEQEKNCADLFLRGLNTFPPIDNFFYRRIVEPGNEQGGPTETSRTFVNGSFSVRIKQVTLNHPEPGWKPLDEFGICWSR